MDVNHEEEIFHIISVLCVLVYWKVCSNRFCQDRASCYVEKLAANLDVTTRQLNMLMQKDLPQLTGKLNTIADNFIAISDNLKGIDYASTFNKIDSTLYNVQMLTEKLNRKDNSIGLLFNDPTFYQNLSATTANAATLLEDLKAHPKRYVHFSLFGKKDK